MKKILFLLVLLFSVSSCFTDKEAVQARHLRKFLKAGGKITCDTIKETYTDTLFLNGKPVIIERTIDKICPTIEPPKTRWEYRLDKKALEDSIKLANKRAKKREAFVADSLNSLYNHRLKLEREKTKQVEAKANAEIKVAKQENKSLRGWWWILILLGYCLNILVRYLFKRFKLPFIDIVRLFHG